VVFYALVPHTSAFLDRRSSRLIASAQVVRRVRYAYVYYTSDVGTKAVRDCTTPVIPGFRR